MVRSWNIDQITFEKKLELNFLNSFSDFCCYACMSFANGKKSLIIKRPSLTAKMEKFFVCEEKSFIGSAYGLKMSFSILDYR